MKAQTIGIVFIGLLVLAVGTLILIRPGDIDRVDDPASEKAEKFVGRITSYDTGCFADGICSITVDDKVVITTIGFRQQLELGQLLGVDSLGDIEENIGSLAEVYALKQGDGVYSLW